MYYIETSLGTIAVRIDCNSNIEVNNNNLLREVLSEKYDLSDNPFSIEETYEGLYLILHLKDNKSGNPEYKIRKKPPLQTLDYDIDQLSYYKQYVDSCIVS